jgi:hypothetical protein
MHLKKEVEAEELVTLLVVILLVVLVQMEL